MAESALYQDITKYSYWMTAGQLPYTSDRSISNYKKMRYHPMCKLGLNFTILGLTEIPWIVKCTDEEIAAIVDKMLSRIWRQLLREGFECLDYGFKPMEIRYEPGTLKYKVGDDKKERSFSGILLKQPKALDPEYIRILVEEDGSLKGFKQDFTTKEVLVKDKKCLVFVNNFESGNYYGISSFESVYSMWYISSINMQFHTRWLERKGTGLFVGRYPAGKQDDGTDNSDVMNDLLDSIMEGTTVALPSGYDEHGNPLWDIYLLDSEDKTDAFIQFHEYLDKMILRGLVIPERALTQGEIGARSSVEAFSSIFNERRQDILNTMVNYISKYLVKNFVELNWGTEVEVEVCAGKIDDDSKQNAYKIIEKLVEQSQIEIEHKWLAEKTGIPIKEPEEALGMIDKFQKEMEAKKSKPTPKGENPAGEEVPDEEEETPELSEHIHKEKLAEDRWNNMTARERKFDLAAVGNFLDKKSAEFQDSLKSVLTTQKDRIKTYLQKNIGGGKPWDVANEISIFVNPLKRLYKDFLTEVYDYAFTKFQQGTENRVYFAEQGPFISFRSSLSSQKLGNDLETAIKYGIADGIARGLSEAEIIANFEQTYNEFLSARIGTIAETEVGFTLDKANELYIMANHKGVKNGSIPADKKVARMQYTAILDGVVCPLCEKMNGMVVTTDSPIYRRYSPPLHYMCRCIWMPITQGEVDDPRVANTDLTNDPFTGKPYIYEGLIKMLGNDLRYKTFS